MGALGDSPLSPGPTVDLSIYVSLAFLFGIAAQFRAMDGYAFLRGVVVSFERRLGIVYAVAGVTILFSPFILNDVLVIILTPVLIKYASQHDVDPVPLIVAEVTLTNVASALTPLGNPQNILLWSASGVSFEGFVVGTWPLVALSAGLALLALLPFALKLGRPRELPSKVGSKLPAVYLVVVILATLLSDIAGFKPYVPLGVSFLLGFLFTSRSLRKVPREYDFRALAVLYLLLAAVSAFTYVLGSPLSSLAAPVAQGAQPYSGLFVGVTSNLISNVPVTQLVLSSAAVSAQTAPKIAVETGLAGNLGPIASFANLLALQIASGAGVSVRRVILLQLAVGLVAFLPALL